MPGNRARERPGHGANRSRPYPILASVRFSPLVEGEKRQRCKRQIESQKDIKMDATEVLKETLHGRHINNEAEPP